VGPWIVPKDELNLADARVRTYVNGEQKQDGPVSDMLFSINDIIEFVTAFMTLEPGDIIATGTPPGVGPMEAGSEVEVLIEGIGTLKNKLIAESEG
jgi:2-keto-4-pentenoate hydratase/2-oxohepta-3-ene-1,7-dioic acid hydratase in catechol pathway